MNACRDDVSRPGSAEFRKEKKRKKIIKKNARSSEYCGACSILCPFLRSWKSWKDCPVSRRKKVYCEIISQDKDIITRCRPAPLPASVVVCVSCFGSCRYNRRHDGLNVFVFAYCASSLEEERKNHTRVHVRHLVRDGNVRDVSISSSSVLVLHRFCLSYHYVWDNSPNLYICRNCSSASSS